MRRLFSPLVIRGKDGKPVNTYQMAGWSKPGTVGDRTIKRFGPATYRIKPADLSIRQQRRASIR